MASLQALHNVQHARTQPHTCSTTPACGTMTHGSTSPISLPVGLPESSVAGHPQSSLLWGFGATPEVPNTKATCINGHKQATRAGRCPPMRVARALRPAPVALRPPQATAWQSSAAAAHTCNPQPVLLV